MLRMIIISATKYRKNENFVNKQLNSDFAHPHHAGIKIKSPHSLGVSTSLSNAAAAAHPTMYIHDFIW